MIESDPLRLQRYGTANAAAAQAPNPIVHGMLETIESALEALSSQPNIDWKPRIHPSVLENPKFVREAIKMRLGNVRLIDNPSDQLIEWLAEKCPTSLWLIKQNSYVPPDIIYPLLFFAHLGNLRSQIASPEDAEKECQAVISKMDQSVEMFGSPQKIPGYLDFKVFEMLSFEDIAFLQTVKEAPDYWAQKKLCTEAAAMLRNKPDLIFSLFIQNPKIEFDIDYDPILTVYEEFIQEMQRGNERALRYLGTNGLITPEMVLSFPRKARFHVPHQEDPAYILTCIAVQKERDEKKGIELAGAKHKSDGDFMAKAFLLDPMAIRHAPQEKLGDQEFMKHIRQAIWEDINLFRCAPLEIRSDAKFILELKKHPLYLHSDHLVESLYSSLILTYVPWSTRDDILLQDPSIQPRFDWIDKKLLERNLLEDPYERVSQPYALDEREITYEILLINP